MPPDDVLTPPVTSEHILQCLKFDVQSVSWEVAVGAGLNAWHQAVRWTHRGAGSNNRSALGAPPGSTINCFCGLGAPSMPHILWNCAHTRASRIRLGVALPVNRAEERLLCRVLKEIPPPLTATRNRSLFHPGLVDMPTEVCEAHLQDGATLLIATDGGS